MDATRPLLMLLLALHLLSVVFWVGGMAFAYTVLRPAAGALEPPLRMALWRRVFARFLPWVGVAIVLILISGFAMLFLMFGGFAAAPPYVNTMMVLGIIMMLLYGHLVGAPWRRFRTAVDGAHWPDAITNLNTIRMTVGVNLLLGIATIIVGCTGRYW